MQYFAFITNPGGHPVIIGLKALTFDEAETELKNLQMDAIWIFDQNDLLKFVADANKVLGD